MTYKDIVAQAEKLPVDELWLVINDLLRTLQNATRAATAGLPGDEDPFSAARMRGIIKPDGPIPTDEEIKEDYINYLARKYA